MIMAIKENSFRNTNKQSFFAVLMRGLTDQIIKISLKEFKYHKNTY